MSERHPWDYAVTNKLEDFARFESKVAVRGYGDCWPWTGMLDNRGYGRMAIRRKSCIASRVSYEFANGPIPPNGNILHSCDNPSCVNPYHLRVGTQSDNLRDMYERGRYPHQKIFQKDKDEISRLLANGDLTQQEIADRFNTSRASISAFFCNYVNANRPEPMARADEDVRKYRGVLKEKRARCFKFRAEIRPNGKKLRGRARLSAKQAAIDYDLMARAHFGSRAVLNFPVQS